MRGDEWNRLVGEPSALDVDAALAEVRVRAVPIARRSARNKRAVSLLAGVVLIGGAFFAGRADANGGVRVGESGSSQGNWRGRPELVAASGGARPATVLPAVGPTIQRFHITSWTQWDDERFGESEAWVEGPPGVSFDLKLRFLDDAFSGQFITFSTAETTGYQVQSDVKRDFGASPRGLQLTESGWTRTQLQVPRGLPVILYPFGRGGWGEPTTVIHIEGPDLPPQGSLRWDLPQAPQFVISESAPFEVITERRAAWMRSLGIRSAVTRNGSLRVTPTYRQSPLVVRFSLVGRSDGPEVVLGAPGAGPFTIPGIESTVFAWASVTTRHDTTAVCVHVQRFGSGVEADRRAGRPPLRADGCAPLDSRWTPFETLTNQGQRLRMEVIRLPGVSY